MRNGRYAKLVARRLVIRFIVWRGEHGTRCGPENHVNGQRARIDVREGGAGFDGGWKVVICGARATLGIGVGGGLRLLESLLLLDNPRHGQ